MDIVQFSDLFSQIIFIVVFCTIVAMFFIPFRIVYISIRQKMYTQVSLKLSEDTFLENEVIKGSVEIGMKKKIYIESVDIGIELRDTAIPPDQRGSIISKHSFPQQVKIGADTPLTIDFSLESKEQLDTLINEKYSALGLLPNQIEARRELWIYCVFVVVNAKKSPLGGMFDVITHAFLPVTFKRKIAAGTGTI